MKKDSINRKIRIEGADLEFAQNRKYSKLAHFLLAVK